MIYLWWETERIVHVEAKPEFLGGSMMWRGSDSLCGVKMLNTVTRGLRHGNRLPPGGHLCVVCHAESTNNLTKGG